MITEIKALLEATGQFKSVQLAQELQPVSDMATIPRLLSSTG